MAKLSGSDFSGSDTSIEPKHTGSPGTCPCPTCKDAYRFGVTVSGYVDDSPPSGKSRIILTTLHITLRKTGNLSNGGCWRPGAGGSYSCTVNGITLSMPPYICSRSVGAGTPVDVINLSNVTLDIPEGDEALNFSFSCWHSQSGTCPHGHSYGTSHEGPNGTYDITIPNSPLPIHIVEYWNGSHNNLTDGVYLGTMMVANSTRYVPNNPTFSFSGPTDPQHLPSPPVGSTPVWSPKNASGVDGSSSGLQFKEWKISSTNPSGYVWGPVCPYKPRRIIRLVAVWGASALTVEYWDGIPSGNGTLLAKYPPDPIGTNPAIQKGTRHIDAIYGGKYPMVSPNPPVWSAAQLAALTAGSPAGATQPPPQFLGWERTAPAPSMTGIMTPQNVQIDENTVWVARWDIPEPIIVVDENKGACLAGGGLWRSSGGPWQRYPRDFSVVTTECGVPKQFEDM